MTIITTAIVKMLYFRWVLTMVTLFSHEETGSRTRKDVAELGFGPEFVSGA